MKSLVRAACPHDCPDACGVVITVEDGRATRIEGSSEHPVTRGFLCAKVTKYLDRVYSPQRVLYPMKRVSPKGPGGPEGFARITWDEALDIIAARFKNITDRYGPEAILPYSYGGTLGVLGNASMDHRFFYRLGASQLDRTICSEAGGEGLKSVLGAKYGTEPEQFAHSRTIIAWGANVHGNNIHLWPFIEEARQKGARLVVIDPYRTRTAACADWYLPINPGTDVALALGMMHVIITENLYDADYVERFTLGFDQLRERVLEYPPERVAQWTGIAADDIRKLAREYATSLPAAIRVNYGVQRCDNGGMAMRAIAMLPCLTGSWKEVGGGLQLSTSGAFKFDKDTLMRPDLMQASPLGRPARVVNMVELGKWLNATPANPPIMALFVYNSNPAAVAPDHHAVVRGLMRDDLFTVVHEQFLTDTCDYADIVLPATTFFEHKDLVPAYGHYYLQLSHQAIEPLGECRSNVDLFRELALRMGFEDPCFRESVDEMIDGALASGHEFLAGIDRQRLAHEPHVRLNLSSAAAPRETTTVTGAPHPFLPHARGNFDTPSGKAEFYSQRLAQLGLDPVVSFTPPAESRHVPLRNKYPLELLARKADNYVNSTFANLESHRKLERVKPANLKHTGSDAQSNLDVGHPETSAVGLPEQNLEVCHLERSEALSRDLAFPGTTFSVDTLEINSADANSRGLRNGDSVRVFNDRGEVRLTAVVNGSVQPGVVAARLNWAKLSKGGRNINVLTSDRLTDMGGSPAFYSVLVEVEKTEPLGDRANTPSD